MPSPLFSLIIPAYNVQSYIARCLESCIHQSFSDIEILVIDDCGSDESIHIAQAYAAQDCRISIIHNATNLGTLHSRMEGIKIAKGAYVLFVDADDYLAPTACATLYPYLAKNPDIIHFKARYQGDTNASLLANLTHKTRYILPTQWSAKPLRDSEIAHNFFLKSKHFPKFTLWDKCYKTSLLKQTMPYFAHIHTPLSKATDMVSFFLIASLATSYASLKAPLYVYCLNHHSITHNPNAKTKRISNMNDVIHALHTLSEGLGTPHAREIAHTMSSHLRALILLESRFDKSCISNEGGGQTTRFYDRQCAHLPRFSAAYTACLAHTRLALSRFSMARFAILTRLRGFSAILESLPYLCAYPRLYPKRWQAKTLAHSLKSHSLTPPAPKLHARHTRDFRLLRDRHDVRYAHRSVRGMRRVYDRRAA